MEPNFQLLMLSSNLLKSKIPMSGGWVRVGGVDAEFNLAKIQNSYIWGGGGGCQWNQLSTFDAESKFAKKKKFFL